MFKGKDTPEPVYGTKETTTESRPQGNFEPTRISQGTTLRGDLSSFSSAVIEGKVDGTISTQGDLQIGPKGEVGGEVEGKNITVAGRMKGKIFADDRVHLLSGAHVEGDIHSQSLKIEDSVFFHGGCNMGEGARKRRSEGNQVQMSQSNPLAAPSVIDKLKAA